VLSKENSSLFRALLHFLALATFAVSASAQIYKWVDERGVTHYGERPPQGAKASEVPNKLASPSPGSQAAESGKDPRPETSTAPKGAPSQPKPPQTRDEAEAAKRQQQCDQQHAILDRLKQGPPSYTLNEKGEQVPFDNSEIIARQEKRVAEYCKG
jgi:hypothetical protein